VIERSKCALKIMRARSYRGLQNT